MTDPHLRALIERIASLPLWQGVSFENVNATNLDGDNALHWAVGQNDLDAARLLLDSGIEIDQRGDLGHTPLHEACAAGNVEMVQLLVERGADLYALTEGDAPFALARLNGHDHICDLLRPLMDQAQTKDSHVWTRVRIAHLEREIARLKASL